MKKRLLSILLTACMILSLAPTALAAGSGFTDVKADDWFADEVEYVYENNLMNGVGGNAFDPSGNVSRAMVWTTLARIDGVNTAGSDPWYLVGQKWAMEKGVSDGANAMTDISREQLVTMLYRYVGSPMVSAQQMIALNTYPDADKISTWAEEAMAWAIDVGMINGIDGNVAPQGVATRAQLATLLYRYVENVIPAMAKPETYTVTFEYNYDNKGVYTTVAVEDGKTVGPMTAPTRSGYTFAGWYTADGARFTANTAITADVVLYAKWNVYTPVYIPVHTHSYGSWTSNDDDTHTGTCSCTATFTENCRYLKGGDVCYDCGFNRVAVAKIGDAYYTTLAEAVAVGGSVTLLDDVTLAEVLTITKEVTITAASAVTITANEITDVFTVEAGGKLTLGNNVTVTSNTSILYATGGGAIIVDGAALTTANSGYCAAYVDNGSIEVKSGSINQTGTNKATLVADGSNASVLVSGGTVTSDASSTLVAKNGASVTISGGTVETTVTDPAFCAAYANSGGKITMTGGTVTAAAGKGLIADANGTVEMSGGAVSGGVAAHMNSNAIATISGGTINGALFEDDGATLTITGGTFSADPTSYVASGYTAAESSGTWTVAANT